MELDLHDAIRLYRIIEIDTDAGRYSIEPHELKLEGGKTILRGYAIAGPALGWIDLADWSNLKITKKTFATKDRRPHT